MATTPNASSSTEAEAPPAVSAVPKSQAKKHKSLKDTPRKTSSPQRRTGKIEGYLDRQLQVVADDLENFACMLSEAFDENSDNIPQSFRSAVDPLSNRVSKLADLLREQDSRRLVESTRRTFADHPVAVIGGLAALAAALAQVAVVAARRSDTRGGGSGRKLNA